jgi:hypothetical protein
MLLVNARLKYISSDDWYKHLHNNTAVLTISTKIAMLLTTADRRGLTINNRDRTRP